MDENANNINTLHALAQLRVEAVLLHHSVFGKDISEPVIQKYVDAHHYYLTSATNSDLIWMAKAVQQKYDLEALELALRFSNPYHILVRKAKILVYITEVFSVYHYQFVNEKPQRMQAFMILALHSIRTGIKILKGKFLLWRLQSSV